MAWLGDSLARLRAAPADFRPMPDVGSGVMEIRLHGDNEYRETVMKRERIVTKGSGNVFADLGFSPAEARNLRLRSQMMTALRKFIEKEGLTQAGAARRLSVSQPRVSDLTRGKISRFSLDTLVNMLSDAGLEVDVRIKLPSRRLA
jgi:predicted XRE-type DNA-binding protein